MRIKQSPNHDNFGLDPPDFITEHGGGDHPDQPAGPAAPAASRVSNEQKRNQNREAEALRF